MLLIVIQSTDFVYRKHFFKEVKHAGENSTLYIYIKFRCSENSSSDFMPKPK